MVVGVILVVLGLGFYGYKMYHQNQTSPVARVAPPTATLPLKNPAPNNSATSKSDISNQALDKDFLDVQGSLNKLDSDQKTANTDTSSQDTPPAQ